MEKTARKPPAVGKQKRIMVLSDDWELLSLECECRNEDMAGVVAKKDDLKRIYETTALQNNKLRAKLLELQSAVKGEREQVMVLKDDRDWLSLENEFLNREMAEMSAERDNLKKSFEATTLENNELREQLVNLQSKVKAKQEKIMVLNDDVDFISLEKEYLNQEMVGISAERDNLKISYEAATLEINKLSEQLVDLQRATEAKEEKIKVLMDGMNSVSLGKEYPSQKMAGITAKENNLNESYKAATLETRGLRKQFTYLTDTSKKTEDKLLSELQTKQAGKTLISILWKV